MIMQLVFKWATMLCYSLRIVFNRWWSETAWKQKKRIERFCDNLAGDDAFFQSFVIVIRYLEYEESLTVL